MKQVILFFSLIILSTTTYAQLFEVGAGVGVLHYKGDATPRFKPFAVKPGANIFFRYNLSRAVSLKANGLIGSFYGADKEVNDPFNQARDYTFSTKVQEGNIQLEYNFLNFRTNASRITSEWTPYVFGGVGWAVTNSTSTLKYYGFGTNPNGTPNGILGNNYVQYKEGDKAGVSIPFGIGFKVKINDNWNWGIEFGTRKTFKDDIDNFGNYKYKDPITSETTVLNLPLGLSSNYRNDKLQQGLVSTKDMYYYTSFSISYVFYNVHCPARK